MKKIFGVEAELNITADDDIAHGIGKGVQKGSAVISDIKKEIMPVLTESIKNYLAKKVQK